MPASAATTWCSGWTATPRASPRWAARAPTGSARRRSPRAPHVFQNLGDGTYNHSGSWRSAPAIAAGANITYKILFNDAVAMTGGQTQRRRPHGAADRPRRCAAEGAKRIAIVTDEPDKYPAGHRLARRASRIHHRDELDAVQRELRGDPRRHGADLRPDLRRREAPPPQARRLPRSRQARHHQRAGLRGLRRLRREVELRRRCSRSRPSSAASARSTSRAATRTFPASRASARPSSRCTAPGSKKAAQAAAAPTDRCRRCPSRRSRAAAIGRHLRHHRHRRRRHRRRHHRRAPRHGGASRGQGRRRDRHGRPRAEGRRGAEPPADRRAAGGHPRHPRRRAASADLRARLRHRRRRHQEGAGRADAGRAAPVVVNVAEVLPGDFTRNADYSLPTERLKRAIAAAVGDGTAPSSSTPRGIANAVLGERSPPTC